MEEGRDEDEDEEEPVTSPIPDPPAGASPGSKRDHAARMAGALLIVTAIATVVAVLGRVAAGADQPTLQESMAAVMLNSRLYITGGAVRLISGVTLIAGALFLLRTWIIRERLGTLLVPALFIASGAFTAASGACAVALAISLPDEAATTALYTRGGAVDTIADLRWLTGKTGFAAAGLALIVAARYQWKVGGTLRRIAPLTALLGVSMQLIWIDAATVLHRITGPAFVVWLIAIGGMLFAGRVERHFAAMPDSRRTGHGDE